MVNGCWGLVERGSNGKERIYCLEGRSDHGHDTRKDDLVIA